MYIYFLGTTKADDTQPLYFENFNLMDPITPVNVDVLEKLLNESHYSETETLFLVNGFRYGFELGYTGPKMVRQTSHNLKIRVGSEMILWNKVMKEVKLKRFAGPFKTIPFDHFIQLPIGLVPKDGGNDCRLIFHLSHPRGKSKKLVNANTPSHLCSVKYPDFSKAVQLCQKVGRNATCFCSKSDWSSTFRYFPIKKCHWNFLLM